MELIRNKRTGKVLLIVEGGKHEFNLMKKIFEELIEKYNFDINNAATYYLFDRDPESNTNKELILNLIRVLKNAYENDNYIRGGMLILSYPSIEAYEVSNFIDKSYEKCKKLGTEVKQYIQDNAKIIAMNKISGDSIIHATAE